MVDIQERQRRETGATDPKIHSGIFPIRMLKQLLATSQKQRADQSASP
ncbi:hypothetical protein [Noviherbaspirillum aerium]|nr:hypothetical protein [Noviherbaspirillum aerium]